MKALWLITSFQRKEAWETRADSKEEALARVQDHLAPDAPDDLEVELIAAGSPASLK